MYIRYLEEQLRQSQELIRTYRKYEDWYVQMVGRNTALRKKLEYALLHNKVDYQDYERLRRRLIRTQIRLRNAKKLQEVSSVNDGGDIKSN